MPRRTDDRRAPEEDRPPEADHREPRPGPAAWLASTLVRMLLALVGVAVLLYALSMALGVDLFAWLGQALATQTGRWLAVAFAALLLITIALRGFRPARAYW